MTVVDRLARGSESKSAWASGIDFIDRGKAIFGGFLLGGFVFTLVFVFLGYRARVRGPGRVRTPAEALQKLRGYKAPAIDQGVLVTFPIVPEREGTVEPRSDD